MRKYSPLIFALIMGASSVMLTACDDDTPKTSQFTPEQQLRLAEIKSNERIELERARMQAAAANPQLQRDTSEYASAQDYVDSVPSNVSGHYVDNSSSSVGTHVLAAGAGAVGGYLAGKAASKPENQQKIEEYKRKAYTQYRYNRAKVTSKYRSFKKRK